MCQHNFIQKVKCLKPLKTAFLVNISYFASPQMHFRLFPIDARALVYRFTHKGSDCKDDLKLFKFNDFQG